MWVRSSSDLSPASRYIEGLIVMGGISMTVITAHSGLALSGLNPRTITSSSGIFSSHSLISVGQSFLGSGSFIINLYTSVRATFWTGAPQ